MFTLPKMHAVQSGMFPREIQKKILFSIYITSKSDLFLSECCAVLESTLKLYCNCKIFNYLQYM